MVSELYICGARQSYMAISASCDFAATKAYGIEYSYPPFVSPQFGRLPLQIYGFPPTDLWISAFRKSRYQARGYAIQKVKRRRLLDADGTTCDHSMSKKEVGVVQTNAIPIDSTKRGYTSGKLS